MCVLLFLLSKREPNYNSPIPLRKREGGRKKGGRNGGREKVIELKRRGKKNMIV